MIYYTEAAYDLLLAHNAITVSTSWSIRERALLPC